MSIEIGFTIVFLLFSLYGFGKKLDAFSERVKKLEDEAYRLKRGAIGTHETVGNLEEKLGDLSSELFRLQTFKLKGMEQDIDYVNSNHSELKQKYTAANKSTDYNLNQLDERLSGLIAELAKTKGVFANTPTSLTASDQNLVKVITQINNTKSD